MSSASTTTHPPIGRIVNYVTTTNRDNELRQAVVVGAAGWDRAELHLAVLTDTGADLDLISLAVPPDPTGVSIGTWHAPPAAAWPDDEPDEPDANNSTVEGDLDDVEDAAS